MPPWPETDSRNPVVPKPRRAVRQTTHLRKTFFYPDIQAENANADRMIGGRENDCNLIGHLAKSEGPPRIRSGGSAESKATLTIEAPVHTGRGRKAGNLSIEVPLQRRCPWNKSEAEAVVDHGEAPGRKRETLAVDAGDMLALRCSPGGQPGPGGNALAGRPKLALAKGAVNAMAATATLPIATTSPRRVMPRSSAS